MKVEIEINEAEVQAALKGKVSEAIRAVAHSYATQSDIEKRVTAAASEVIDAEIALQLEDLESIHLAVRKAIENKLKARLNKLMEDV